MKQRFSSLDIKVIAHELAQTLPSLRVSNIYDLSSRILLFKFAKPNHREQLVLDTGFRCHLTSFARTTAAEPSAFVSKLRKFLKTRRVTSVSQVGTDRILEIQFSDGQYRLFLEFYASGNLVLTDQDLKVLALFRIVNEGAEHERIRPGSTYNLSERQNINGMPPLTTERVKEGLRSYIERQAAYAENSKKPKKSNKKADDTLRKALSNCINEFPPMLIEHALRIKGFDLKVGPEEVVEDDTKLSATLEALQEAGHVMDGIMNSPNVKGYIVCQVKGGTAKAPEVSATAAGDPSGPADNPKSNLLYYDFHPFKPKQFEDQPDTQILDFDGYNKTVDEFFSSLEGQKLESRLQDKEDAAKKKIENARQVQQNRIEGLQAAQELNFRKAQAIEGNLERVSEATAAINGLIAQGMDWVEIDRLIELEQKRNNPVAEVIKLPLNLNENTATLLLYEWDFAEEEDDDDDNGDLTDSEPAVSDDEAEPAKETTKDNASAASKKKPLSVDIDLALSAWANSREYYDQKKTAAAKEDRTVQASSKALKSAKQKIDADLKRALKQETQVLRPIRQQMWFEKFIYFISSDGYLVVGGKDGQQCDLLYKRHLKPGDVYVHADLNGAASVIIKNNSATPNAPIPPSTLSQAGNLSVATSTAWDSKAIMSAWWVTAEDISKTASTGDYLSPGSFEVKGEKNFLPPAQLLLGFAVMFQISEASKANHTKHRAQASTIEDGDIAPTNRQVTTEQEDEIENDDNASIDENEQESEEDYDNDETDAPQSNPLQTSTSPTENLLWQDSADQPPSNELTDPPPAELTESEKNSVNGEEDQNLADDESEVEEDEDRPDTESKTESGTATPSQTSKQNLPIRGKRGKRKKMQQKYAHQDEEDREAAMRLLGSRIGQEKAEKEAQVKKSKEAEITAQKQRRREQHSKRENEGRAIDQKRQQQLQTGEGGLEEQEDVEAPVDLETLVGAPLPSDEIIEAIPVCAPWNALGRYKYKAKMQPGTQKKGKAVREILGKWTADGKNKKNVDEKSQDTDRIWPRELELISNWREAEVMNVLPVSKVRVMMSGGSGGKGNANASAKGKGRGKGGKGSKK